MIDSHVHIGWFVDRYHSPDDVTAMLRTVGVDGIVVSSTSTCAEEYDTVLHEMEWLQEEWEDRIYPLLWITPKMIKTGALGKMIASSIKWGGIKMHWHAHPEFFEDLSILDEFLNDKRFAKMPVLTHTGEFPECHASVFETIISKHPERNFILAHGRPIKETTNLLKHFNNVYVDTAFMPMEHIEQLINQNLVERILWGSDCPISEHYYEDVPASSYLSNRILQLRDLVNDKTFAQLTEINVKTAYRYER